MMLFLLLAAAQPQVPPAAPATEPQTAIEAERAFAADAQTLGQWSAFRKWAGDDATMFLPQPVNGPAVMLAWRDPPRAIVWSPAASYLSCDGTMAANTGPWTQPNGTVGFFSTIWVKRAAGWRWDVDGGDQLSVARPAVAQPVERRAACTGSAPALGPMMPTGPGDRTGYGHAPDNTLQWFYYTRRDGSRDFTVLLWDGDRMARVIDDHIAAPPATPAPRPETP